MFQYWVKKERQGDDPFGGDLCAGSPSLGGPCCLGSSLDSDLWFESLFSLSFSCLFLSIYFFIAWGSIALASSLFMNGSCA